MPAMPAMQELLDSCGSSVTPGLMFTCGPTALDAHAALGRCASSADNETKHIDPQRLTDHKKLGL
jgi:hypothetical protein